MQRTDTTTQQEERGRVGRHADITTEERREKHPYILASRVSERWDRRSSDELYRNTTTISRNKFKLKLT